MDILGWTNPSTFIETHGGNKCNIILVADPIYSSDHPILIINMIVNFLKPNGICHLQIPIRDKYAKER